MQISFKIQVSSISIFVVRHSDQMEVRLILNLRYLRGTLISKNMLKKIDPSRSKEETVGKRTDQGRDLVVFSALVLGLNLSQQFRVIQLRVKRRIHWLETVQMQQCKINVQRLIQLVEKLLKIYPFKASWNFKTSIWWFLPLETVSKITVSKLFSTKNLSKKQASTFQKSSAVNLSFSAQKFVSFLCFHSVPSMQHILFFFFFEISNSKSYSHKIKERVETAKLNIKKQTQLAEKLFF